MATIFSEDFESAAAGAGQTALGAFDFAGGASQSFSDDDEDFLTVTDGTAAIGGAVAYQGATGQFLAGMDLDAEGATLPIVVEVSGIDITGRDDLSLSLDAAEDDDGANQDWDIADFVHVAARIDGGAFTDLINFESIPDGDDFNAEPGRDADFDGNGDAGAALTDSFRTFTSPIAGSGSTLDLRITLSLDSGDEDIALDNIVIEDGAGSGAGTVMESFEAAPGATYTLSNSFDDGGFVFFDRYAVPDTANAARDDFSGFDGAFAILGQDHDGDGAAATQTVTIPNIDISGVGDLAIAAKVGAPSGEPDFENYEAADGDGIEIYATIDGGARSLVGAFAPPADGAGDLREDTDLDGIGDGAALTGQLEEFVFDPLGTGNLLTLEIELTSTDGFEPLALDKVSVGEADDLIGPGPVFTDRLIHEIQGATDLADATLVGVPGAADESPLLDTGARVQGIVTQVLPDLGGFYMQEEDADADGDAATSEGIFVEAGDGVAAGDRVTIEGIVAETEGETRLEASSVTVDSSANPLPAPVEISFPTATVLEDADGDFVANLEAYEGMRVTVPEAMAVTELFQLDRFGTMTVSSEGRLEQFTQNSLPDVAGFEQHLRDNAARSLVIDDGLDGQNPTPIRVPDLGADGTLDAGDVFRMGDEYLGLTGVLGFSEDEQSSAEEPEYRLHRPDGTLSQQNPRPADAPEVNSDYTVAALNVLNFFTTLDTFPDDEGVGPNGEGPRGADTNPQAAVSGVGPTDEYDRQLAKLVEALTGMAADVVGLVEIENDFRAGGQSPDDPAAQAPRGPAVEALVEAVNAALGADVYDWADPGAEFVGDDVIATAFIYDATTTRLAPGTSVEVLDDSDLGTAGIPAFPNGVFDGDSTNRASLAASFEEIDSGEVFTAAVNHFKSKGSVNAAPGNAAQGDGQGNNNALRLQAAEALDAWLDTDPTGAGDGDVLILGDLNAYAREDPIRFLEGEGYTDLVRGFAGADASSFVFSGQKGTLDYAMASEDLFGQVTGAADWAINSPEPDALDYNLDFGRDPALFSADDAFRASDHDPVIVGLSLGDGAPAAPAGVLRGTGRDDLIVIGNNTTYLGLGGEDTYLLSQAVQPNGLSILEDTGPSVVQLTDGLAIAGSRVDGGALELTLDNGAVVRVFGAEDDLFEIGGNATTGEAGITRDFDGFLAATLGVEVGPDGAGAGGAVTIGEADALI